MIREEPGGGTPATGNREGTDQEATEDTSPTGKPQARGFFGIHELRATLAEFCDLKERDGNEQRATGAQIRALLKLHIRDRRLSSRSADLILSVLEYRQQKRLASLQQVSRLIFAGFENPAMLTAQEAYEEILRIDREGDAK